MAGFLEKLRGGPDAEEVKRRADAAAMKSQQDLGGLPKEEEGLEEGDLTDYVMPFTGLGKNILKTIVEKGLKEGAKMAAKGGVKQATNMVKNQSMKKALDKIEPAKPAEVKPIDYKNENIAFRPTVPGKQVGWERFERYKK